MWQAEQVVIRDAGIHQYSLRWRGQTASYADVIQAWREDPAFCDLFNSLLADSEFSAFRWDEPTRSMRSCSFR